VALLFFNIYQNNQKPGGIMIIGLDIGYGLTKIVDSNGRVDTFKFLVGVGSPLTMNLPISEKKKIRTVHIEGNTYTIGEDVERYELPVISVRQRNSIESMAYKALILAAVRDSISGDMHSNKIVTGLPVRFINDAEILKKTFYSIIPSCEIVVIPQPAGIFFDLILDSQGNVEQWEYANSRVGVVDIGTYTTDLLLFDHMEAIDTMSGTITIGINTLSS